MKIVHCTEAIKKSSTSTEPTKYKLELTAVGDYNEIKWYEEQLRRVGVEPGVIKKNADGLLPCPFCGNDRVHLLSENGWYKVQCSNSECAALMEDCMFQETARNTWNKRT